jgi:hypothetical protein
MGYAPRITTGARRLRKAICYRFYGLRQNLRRLPPVVQDLLHILEQEFCILVQFELCFFDIGGCSIEVMHPTFRHKS